MNKLKFYVTVDFKDGTKVFKNNKEILCLKYPLDRIAFLNLISNKAIEKLKKFGKVNCFIDKEQLIKDAKLYNWNLNNE